MKIAKDSVNMIRITPPTTPNTQFESICHLLVNPF